MFKNKPTILYVGYSRGVKGRNYRRATWEMNINEE
jgi:hypothetical protein